MTNPAPPRRVPATPGDERRPTPRRGSDERGDFAIFIAVITASLLFLGGIAYDGTRLIVARQDALHAAGEAARVAAATVASGGTVEQARSAAEDRLAITPLVYGEPIFVSFFDCVGARVRVTVVTGYVFRSAMAAIQPRKPIEAVGSAEAVLIDPSGQPSQVSNLGECALT